MTMCIHNQPEQTLVQMWQLHRSKRAFSVCDHSAFCLLQNCRHPFLSRAILFSGDSNVTFTYWNRKSQLRTNKSWKELSCSKQTSTTAEYERNTQPGQPQKRPLSFLNGENTVTLNCFFCPSKSNDASFTIMNDGHWYNKKIHLRSWSEQTFDIFPQKKP